MIKGQIDDAEAALADEADDLELAHPGALGQRVTPAQGTCRSTLTGGRRRLQD